MNDIKPFILYPNAQVKLSDGNTIESIYYITACVLESFKDENAKLMLKDLTSITDEDKRELAILVGHGDAKSIIIGENRFIFSGESTFDGDNFWGWAEIVEFDDLPYKAADFLRQGGVKKDCGYCIDLEYIEQGVVTIEK